MVHNVHRNHKSLILGTGLSTAYKWLASCPVRLPGAGKATLLILIITTPLPLKGAVAYRCKAGRGGGELGGPTTDSLVATQPQRDTLADPECWGPNFAQSNNWPWTLGPNFAQSNSWPWTLGTELCTVQQLTLNVGNRTLHSPTADPERWEPNFAQSNSWPWTLGTELCTVQQLTLNVGNRTLHSPTADPERWEPNFAQSNSWPWTLGTELCTVQQLTLNVYA